MKSASARAERVCASAFSSMAISRCGSESFGALEPAAKDGRIGAIGATALEERDDPLAAHVLALVRAGGRDPAGEEPLPARVVDDDEARRLRAEALGLDAALVDDERDARELARASDEVALLPAGVRARGLDDDDARVEAPADAAQE